VRVGLVWKDNPRFEIDPDRSLPGLEMLVPLGRVAGVRFISLQKGEGEDQAMCSPDGLPLMHLGSQIEDFADTAAIVANLGLVICELDACCGRGPGRACAVCAGALTSLVRSEGQKVL
jgi:hypothetical protein